MAKRITESVEQLVRPNYFDGQFLTAREFVAEQNYHRKSLQLYSRMFSPGIIVVDGDDESLLVRELDTHRIRVHEGVALDHKRRLLVLPADQDLDLLRKPGPWPKQTVLIVITYQEEKTEPADYGTREATRWVEKAEIKVVPESKGVSANQIVLAKITLDQDGRIVRCDLTERPFARLYRPTTSGWMRLLFLPKPYAGGDVGRDDFTLLGTRAASPATGADGCIEILIPPGVTWIKQLRIGGKSSSSISLSLRCVGADASDNPYLEETIPLLQGNRDFSVDKSLKDDDALVLIVRAAGESEICFVAAEFD